MEEKYVVIIGAGPAGLSAAIFARLDGWNTLVLESNWVGGQGAIAYTVMNYPGFPPGDGAVLIENLQKQVTSSPPNGLGAEIKFEKALKIDTENMIITTEQNQYRASVIILATGSVMKKLCVPGEDKFIGKGVSYYAKRDYNRFNGKKVIVVGGGNSTAKNSIVAKKEGKASKVIQIHRRSSLRAYPLMVKRLQKEGIEVLYNTEVNEIKGTDKVQAVNIINKKTNEEHEIPADWIVICIGTKPDIKLAQEAGLEIIRDFVNVNEKMMTSKPGIFACGEITGCVGHLINAATEGASAGMAASEYLALQKVKRGEVFKGAKNGKYANEYLQMIKKDEKIKNLN